MKLLPEQKWIITGAVAFAAALVSARVWEISSKPKVLLPIRAEQVRRELQKPATPFPVSSVSAKETDQDAPPVTQKFDGAIGQAVQLSGGASPSESARLAKAMAALGPDAVAELGAAMMAAPSVSAKTTIAKALAMIGTSEAADQLVSNLEAISSPTKRKAVGQSLVALSDMYGLETLTSALALIDDPVLRQSVNAAISQNATPDTIQYLTELYRQPPNIPSQAENVTSAISGIVNPAAADTLRQIVGGAPELQLQTAAATSLARIGTPEALDGLLGGLFRVGDTNPNFRQTLLNLVASVSNPASEAWLAGQNANSNLPSDIAVSISAALNNVRKRASAGP